MTGSGEPLPEASQPRSVRVESRLHQRQRGDGGGVGPEDARPEAQVQASAHRRGLHPAAAERPLTYASLSSPLVPVLGDRAAAVCRHREAAQATICWRLRSRHHPLGPMGQVTSPPPPHTL
jgi:hypothetical protein